MNLNFVSISKHTLGLNGLSKVATVYSEMQSNIAKIAEKHLLLIIASNAFKCY